MVRFALIALALMTVTASSGCSTCGSDLACGGGFGGGGLLRLRSPFRKCGCCDYSYDCGLWGGNPCGDCCDPCGSYGLAGDPWTSGYPMMSGTPLVDGSQVVSGPQVISGPQFVTGAPHTTAYPQSAGIPATYGNPTYHNQYPTPTEPLPAPMVLEENLPPMPAPLPALEPQVYQSPASGPAFASPASWQPALKPLHKKGCNCGK